MGALAKSLQHGLEGMESITSFAENYDHDPEAGVWLGKNRGSFNYSDGDRTETVLGEALSAVQDRSVLSDELKPLQTNWPARYYFSGTRSNLLRPLAKKLLAGARVLELGCGLGAITRYLGETAAEVVAVEGSKRRGSIAALRCADLDNVEVLIDEISSLPDELGKFDVVTLIGVLEYACRFGGPGAELEILKKARSFLAPDGFLILAIENKLGLKYLGGVPEDHVPLPWLGITNGYAESGVKTWSRKELLKLLQKAGFQKIEQFIPLPDYKLPGTIITPEGLTCDAEELDLGPILNNCRRLYENAPMFNIGEAWQSVYKGGLLPDLADSLCFVATADKARPSPFETGELVCHYGDLTLLPRKFAKEVIINRKAGQIEVARKNMAPEAASEAGNVRQVVENEPYYSGELLFSKIRRLTMRPDWTLDQLFEALEPWTRILVEDADESGKCAGKLLDYVPFNIVLQDGRAIAFDQEWIAKERLLLTHLLFRGLYHTLLRMMPLRRSSQHNAVLFSDIFNALIAKLGISPDIPASLPYLRWQEAKLMRALSGFSKFRSPEDFKINYM